MTAPLLETRALGREFGALQALSDVTLAVAPRELRAVIGPNGAGKTTFFHLLSGILRPTRGEILFRGETVTALPAHARCRRGISRTFQVTSLFPELSVLENVRLAIQAKHGGNTRLLGGRGLLARTRARAHEALGFFGLADRPGVAAGTLPHGDQRLLEIAPLFVRMLGELLGRLRAEGLTLLLVEQNVRLALAVADRVAVLSRGTVVFAGATAEFHRRGDELRGRYLAV